MRDKALLLLILVVAFTLRTVNLYEVPWWMWDEGANINYAQNLMDGQVRYFGYMYNFVPHPPVYLLFLTAWFKIFGVGMYQARMLSVLMSLAQIMLVYEIVKLRFSKGWGVFAAASAAVFPEHVFWSRMAFANNMLALMGLSAIYLLTVYGRSKDLTKRNLAAAVCSVAPLVEYTGFSFVLALWLYLRDMGDRDTNRIAALSLAPTALFFAAMSAFRFDGFSKDLINYFGIYPLALPLAFLTYPLYKRVLDYVCRFSDSKVNTPAEYIVFLLALLFSFFQLDHFNIISGKYISAIFVTCLIGFLWLDRSYASKATVAFLMSYGLVILGVGRWDHMSIPVISFIALTPTFLLHKVWDYLVRADRKKLAVPLAAIYVLSLCLCIEGFYLEKVSRTDTSLIQEVVEKTNELTHGDGAVVVQSYMGYMIDADPVLYTHTLLWEGYMLGYFRRSYSHDEFYLSHDIDEIQYVILPESVYHSLNQSQYSRSWEKLKDFEVIDEVSYTHQVKDSRNELLGWPGKKSYLTEYVLLENTMD